MTSIFHASDLHFGAEDRAALEWFSRCVIDEKPDAVVITGDLTMAGRKAEFAAATEWLATLAVPITLEPGNHDLPVHNLWKRFITPYGRYRRFETALERPLDLAGVTIVPLRTATRAQLRLNWSHGVVRRGSLKATLEMLAEAPADRLRIVACHHPLTDPAGFHTEGRTRGGQRALAELTRAGVTAVLSGHVHDPFDEPWQAEAGQIRMIGAGTLSERVRASAPSFNELTVDAGALELRVRTMEARG